VIECLGIPWLKNGCGHACAYGYNSDMAIVPRYCAVALASVVLVTPACSAPLPEPDDIEEIQQILRDLAIQSGPLARGDSASLRAEDLRRFSDNVRRQYPRDNDKSDFRDTVTRVRDILSNKISPLPMKGEVSATSDMVKVKEDLLDHQKDVARAMRSLKEGMETMKAAAADREKEPSRRWQAHYDYMLARLQLQIGYLFEYQTALGRVRRDGLPALADTHDAWKLVPSETEGGDAEGKKYSAAARKQLEKIIKDYPESPWAELAERALKQPFGLEWQSFQTK
jgi:hypothetical protein